MSHVSMGIAVIGGVLFSLVLTLYVIPAMCSYLSKVKTGGTVGGGRQSNEGGMALEERSQNEK